MSILSTNRKLIRVGTEYSAGPNIDIQDDVISGKDWTEEIAEASANAYNAATAQIPVPFDPSYISGQIDNKLDTTAFTAWQNGQYATDLQTIEGQISNKLDESSFSEVSGSFYTNDNPSGFITGVDLSPYYTTADANSLSSMLSAAIDYVSANASDDFPHSADEAIQTYQQNSGTYLTEDDIVNKLDISAFTAWSAQEFENDYELSAGEGVKFYEDDELKITRIDVTGGGGGGGDSEVNSFVYDNSATIVDVDTTYQQNSASYLTSHQDISYKLDTTAFSTVSGDFLTAAPADMATTGDVAELAQTISETYQTKGDYLVRSDSANFYPANNPSGFITGVDLSDYYTKDETSGKEELSNAFANVPTPDYEVESYIHNNSASIDGTSTVVQSNSSTWSDVTAYQSNSSTYITAHQSLEGYATTAWVDEQGYITEVNIPESATWNEVSTTVQTNSSNWDDVTNKLDTTSFSDVSGTFLTAVDLTPYQTIEGMTAYQPVGDYATTAEVDTLSSMLSGAIDYVSANAGDEFPVSADEAIQYVQTNSANIDETVTSFQTNSSTYMVEPNLEYNAVNEISGYNGSAIAQYGAEKQWLVHDDTLVHASNSAQYALGVNLSAVAKLLGVDETVLWEGSVNTNNGYLFNLPEPITNFKTVKVYAADLFGWTESIFEFDPSFIGTENRWSHCLDLTFNTRGALITTGTMYNRGIMLTANEASVNSATQISAYGYENNSTGNCSIQKIIGIGRKQ